jgi:transcriptional regulator with XRE-family HTH domain
MDSIAIGRLLALVRLRQGRRQSDLSKAARLSAAAVGRHEHGQLRSIAGLRRHAGALGLRLDLRLTGRGGELERLADDEHAAIVEVVAQLLRGLGHEVVPEATYNEWGERGRFDLLAYLAESATLDVVEVKGELTDIQEMLGALNAKERLAPGVARRRGWPVRRVRVLLAVAATSRNRHTVAAHPSLFAAFEQHQLSERWLRPTATNRLLLWVPPGRAARTHWVAGRRRVRLPRGRPSLAKRAQPQANST